MAALRLGTVLLFFDWVWALLGTGDALKRKKCGIFWINSLVGKADVVLQSEQAVFRFFLDGVWAFHWRRLDGISEARDLGLCPKDRILPWY